MLNEAALLAARKGLKAISMRELEDARDKVRWGKERRSMAMSEREKTSTAWHEAGHAILNVLLEHTSPLHKVTIIPRGPYLGATMYLPEGDKYSTQQKEALDLLVVTMGGRIAEELTFGKENVTSGAQSDIEQATRLARAMVTRWGYSEELGTVAYGENQEEVFLGHSVSRTQNISEETSQKIDQEVKRLVFEGLSEARRILTEKNHELVALALERHARRSRRRTQR